MKKSLKKRRLLKAFTISELLVIVAIVIVLSAITLVALVPGQGKAKTRDTKRITEVNTIRKALQMYYLDHNHYPEQDDAWCSFESDCTDIIDELTPYLPAIPNDPLYGKGNEPEGILYSYQYKTTDGGKEYVIHSDLETREPYEVYSMGGLAIAQETPPGGGGGGGDSQFIKTIDSASGYSIQKLPSGGYIIAGTEGLPNDARVSLIKLNSDGNLDWTKIVVKIGNEGADTGTGKAVQQTSDGGYIVAGNSGAFNGVWMNELFLIKFTSSGEISWARRIGESFNDDRASFVQQTSDGGYIIGGAERSYAPGFSKEDCILAKFNSNGEFTWARTVGSGSDDNCYDAQQTSDGGFIATGKTEGFSAAARDLLLLKFNPGGPPNNLEWAKRVGGEGNDEGRSIQQVSDGYIVIGRTSSFGTGDYDLFLIKFDLNGDPEWAKRIGSEYDEMGESIQEASDGYIVTGSVDNDLLLVKLGFDGSLNWGKVIGEEWPGQEYGHSALEVSGGYIVVGDKIGSYPDWGLFLAKFDSEGNTCDFQQPVTITASDIPLSSITVYGITTDDNNITSLVSADEVGTDIIDTIDGSADFNDICSY